MRRFVLAGLICCGGAAAAADAVGRETFTALPARMAAAAAVDTQIDVRLLPRARQSDAAWSTRDDTYQRDYVYPKGWLVRLDGCRSSIDGVRVASTGLPGPAWSLEPLGGQTTGAGPVGPIDLRAAPAGTCSTNATLPAVGRWRITMALRDAAGAVATGSVERGFRDVLVAAVGDSFASGEGNKDRRTGWVDGQCHRSKRAWPENVAAKLQTDSTTVTFVSFACSGATVSRLISAGYAGVDGHGQKKLKPQLRALHSLLGDPLAPATRPVNVLLGHAGINDLGGGAGSLLERCSLLQPNRPCVQDLHTDLAAVSREYNRLDAALQAEIKYGAAYFGGYPARLFEHGLNTGCGGFRLRPSSVQWVIDTVEDLNRRAGAAARRYGWGFTSVTELFRHHGYCDGGNRWINTNTDSKRRQGDKYGTAHPNTRGHMRTAKLIASRVRTNVAVPPPDRFVVRFLRLRMSDRRPARVPWPGFASIGVSQGTNGCADRTKLDLTQLKLNRWNDLRRNPCARFDVRTVGRRVRVGVWSYLSTPHHDNPPQDEQQPVGGEPSRTRGIRTFTDGRLLRRTSNWSATPPIGPTHIVRTFRDEHDKGRLEVKYEITKETVAAPLP